MSTDVALSVDEEADLSSYEEVIANGIRTFVEVGHALAEIRDRKLYRQTHLTFEAYCDQQWQISRSRAYQMIDAAQTVMSLSTIVDTPVKNEAQARELSGLEPVVAAEVVNAAAEAGPVTAKSLGEHREKIAPREMPIAKVTEQTKTETFVNTDTGEIVEPVKPQATDAQVMAAVVKDDPAWDAVNFQAKFAADILKAHKAILEWSTDEVAEKADPSQFDSLDELANSLTLFATEARRKRGGLRLVGSK